MNEGFYHSYVLKGLRKLYYYLFTKKKYTIPHLQREENINTISEIISNYLSNDTPCMIARFGAFELGVAANYLSVKQKHKSVIKYIKGDIEQWWWNSKLVHSLNQNAGFFPINNESLEKYSQLLIADSKYVDVLGSWQIQEIQILKNNNCIKVDRDGINPFFAKKPWTKSLEGKRILVIHPFYKSIRNQYLRKDLIFPNGLLPTFELTIIPAIQSIGGHAEGYNSWFDALEYMKSEMDKVEYDICLIGCGAYGFHLAAHAKRMGKKAIHLGGSLQLLFGIKGKRWESNGYQKANNNYSTFFNEYWIRPSDDEKPQISNKIENNCYW